MAHAAAHPFTAVALFTLACLLVCFYVAIWRRL